MIEVIQESHIVMLVMGKIVEINVKILLVVDENVVLLFCNKTAKRVPENSTNISLKMGFWNH